MASPSARWRCPATAPARAARARRRGRWRPTSPTRRAIAPHFAGVERVFHTAALVHGWHPWERYRAVNVGGTQTVARAARAPASQRLVHVSTSDVFGIPRGDEVLDEIASLRPLARAVSRHQDRSRAVAVAVSSRSRPAAHGDLSGLGVRSRRSSVLSRLRAGDPRRLLVFWQRDTTLAWAYVDNLADAIVLVGRDPAAVGHGYLVHDGADGPTLRRGLRPHRGDRSANRSRRRGTCRTRRVRRRWRRADGLARPAPARRPALLTVDVKAFGSASPSPTPRSAPSAGRRAWHRRGYGAGVRVLHVAPGGIGPLGRIRAIRVTAPR